MHIAKYRNEQKYARFHIVNLYLIGNFTTSWYLIEVLFRTSYFCKLYAPLFVNSSLFADEFTDSLSDFDYLQVTEQCQNRQQSADDFKMLFSIPWDHYCRLLSKCKGDMDNWVSISQQSIINSKQIEELEIGLKG